MSVDFAFDSIRPDASGGSLALLDATGAERITVRPDGVVLIPSLLVGPNDLPFFSVTAYGALGDGADDTAAIQAAIDAAWPVQGTVIFARGKVYMVKSLILRPGVQIDLNGSTLRRFDNQPNWQRMFTTLSLWEEAYDSPLTVVRNGVIDGRRAYQGAYLGYQLEQCQLIYLDAPTSTGGRLRVKLEDLVLKESTSDGVMVRDNVDLTFSNLTTDNCYRGGLTVGGGNNVIRGINWTPKGDVHPYATNMEPDGAGGYGGTFRNEVYLTNVPALGDWDMAMKETSIVELTNVDVKRPTWTLSGGGATRWSIKGGSFAIGYLDAITNRIMAPGRMRFTGTEFVISEAYLSTEADRIFRGVHLYWQQGASTYTGQRVWLDDCSWRVDGSVEGTDTVYAFTLQVGDTSTSGLDNRVIFNNPTIPAAFGRGIYIEQGGRVTIRGGHIESPEPVWASMSATRLLDLTLDDYNPRGAGKWIHVQTGVAGSRIEIRNCPAIVEADAGWTTAVGIATLQTMTFVGRRELLVESDPTLRLAGFFNDLAVRRTATAGGTDSWKCTTPATGATAAWKAHTTLAA